MGVRVLATGLREDLFSFSDLLKTKYVIRPELSIKDLMHILNFLPVLWEARLGTQVIKMALSPALTSSRKKGLAAGGKRELGSGLTVTRRTAQHGQGDAE